MKLPRLDEIEELNFEKLTKIYPNIIPKDENSQIAELSRYEKTISEYVRQTREDSNLWALEQDQDVFALALDIIYKMPVYKNNPENFQKLNKTLKDLKNLIVESGSELRLNFKE